MQKITVLTAYDFNTARALAEAGIDLILVGDSLAMVALGYPDTTKLSLGEMLIALRAVRRGAPKAKIIADIPFKVVKQKMPDFLKSVDQLVKAGADILKIENASTETLEQIKAAQDQGIEVMGHIGYTPQDLDKFPKPALVKDKEQLMQEALKLEEVGVTSMVLEMVPSDIAKEITEKISIPTIGIGAGKDTSGQVLVSDDLLGRFNLFKPKFLRRYANQYEEMLAAFKNYASDVRSGEFPSDSESF